VYSSILSQERSITFEKKGNWLFHCVKTQSSQDRLFVFSSDDSV